MKGLVKKKSSKRVSWASGVKLWQVKLFLSEDCPSKVCLQAHDHLKAKTSMHHSNSVYSDNHPSRSEGRHSLDPLRRKFSQHCSRYEGRHLNPLRKKLSRIPQIKWKCPPKFVFKNYWQVANGEESGEASTQKHRETGVLEAIYSCLSDIPPSPSLPLDVQEDQVDDSHIRLIPITPVEEEEMVDLLSDKAAQQNAYFDLQPSALTQGLLSKNTDAPYCDPSTSVKSSANEKPALKVRPGFQPDVVAASASSAADIAVTAIMKSKEQAGLIDTDLLIKLLRNPKMIGKMIDEQGAPASAKTEHVSGSKLMTASVPLPSIKPALAEEVINEDGAVMKVGSTSPSGANLVRELVAKPSPKADPNMKKSIDEHRTAAPSSGSRPVTFSGTLPSRKPGPVIEKSTHKHRTPTDTGAAPVSVPNSVTSQVAAPSQRPPVVKKSGNEHGVVHPKPSPLMENLTHKPTETNDSGSAPVSGPKPVTSRVGVLSTANPAVNKSVIEQGVRHPQLGPSMENSNHMSTHGAHTPTYRVPGFGRKPLMSQLAMPCSRPGPVVKQPPNEYGVSIPKPSPVVGRSTCEQGPPTDTGAAPVSRQKLVKSRLALPSPKPDTVVRKSVYEHGMPSDSGDVSSSAHNRPTLLSSFPSSKPDWMKIKKMISEYGTPDDRKGNEPISRSMPLTLQVPILSPKLEFFSPAIINSHPFPNVGEAGLQSKAFLADAGRPNLDTLPNVMQTDLQLKEMSPDMERPNLHPSLNVMQPSFSAMTPPVKDVTYIKNLIRQHGEMQERKDCRLYQYGKIDVHLQDSKQVLINPNELAPVFQRDSAFFNCPNGYKSLVRHDRSEKLQPGSVLEEPLAKRMKLSRETPGWT